MRFAIEFAREPDQHLGFVVGGLSMGQILCIGMIASGAAMMVFRRDKRLPLPDAGVEP